MNEQCPVCSSPGRAEIESAFARFGDVTARKYAEGWGLSWPQISKHWTTCHRLPSFAPGLSAAAERPPDIEATVRKEFQERMKREAPAMIADQREREDLSTFVSDQGRLDVIQGSLRRGRAMAAAIAAAGAGEGHVLAEMAALMEGRLADPPVDADDDALAPAVGMTGAVFALGGVSEEGGFSRKGIEGGGSFSVNNCERPQEADSDRQNLKGDYQPLELNCSFSDSDRQNLKGDYTRAAIPDVIRDSRRPRQYGTSREEALRRLAKDRPDLHARVMAGELSAHAAAIEAGFRAKTVTIPAAELAALREKAAESGEPSS
jgi:hypothetical protein